LTVALVLPDPKAGALAQDGEPPPTFEQAQARTQYARSRMEAAQRKVLSLERKEKAAYEKLTDAQKRYEEAKVAADSATEDLRAAQGEHEEATRRYEQESAQLRRIYLDNEARRKQRSN
jgi:chromosome segregation ATPase